MTESTENAYERNAATFGVAVAHIRHRLEELEKVVPANQPAWFAIQLTTRPGVADGVADQDKTHGLLIDLTTSADREFDGARILATEV